MSATEEQLRSWSAGPSQTEKDRCTNAENMVRKAIAADSDLQSLNITVFAKGSYVANTNVRQNSDVDICVRYNGTFFEHYPEGKSRSDFGNVPGTMNFADFKNMVHKAMADYFGADGVKRGNIALDVHANSYRVDADVVPAFEYRWYTGRLNSDQTHHYYSGTALDPDNGERIKNWPEQTKANGVQRNNETGRRYKRAIRILKRIRDRMSDDGILNADATPSFLIECLVWNADLKVFDHESYYDMMRALIVDLWERSKTDEACGKWKEVNDFKWLFHSSQPWNREGAREFLKQAWNYIG